MKTHRFALVLMVATLAGNELIHSREARASKTADAMASFHVDPRGDDANPGTFGQPFATLERARDAIRERKGSSGRLPPGGVTVILAGGTHPRTAAFELTAEDSGTEEAPIMYASAAGETAVLFGGATLKSSQFIPVEDAALLERLVCPHARKKLRVCDLNAHGEIYGILKWNQDFFYAENLFEELDAPGEYFIDRQSGKLYLIPPERFEDARITVSTLNGPMVRLENARHVTFRNLVFDTGRQSAIIGNGHDLRAMKNSLEEHPSLGLPKQDGTMQKAFTIYAWNEFGEGGIVAPTEGSGSMMLEAIQNVFGEDE